MCLTHRASYGVRVLKCMLLSPQPGAVKIYIPAWQYFHARYKLSLIRSTDRRKTCFEKDSSFKRAMALP